MYQRSGHHRFWNSRGTKLHAVSQNIIYYLQLEYHHHYFSICIYMVLGPGSEMREDRPIRFSNR